MRSFHNAARAVAGLAACMAAGGALAQNNPPPPPGDNPAAKTYDIQARYAPGDLLKYKMQMNMNIELKTPKGDSPVPPQQMNMNTTLRMKTAGVKPDGTAVIVISTAGGEVTAMGNTRPIPATPPVTMEVDKRGIGKMRGMENVPGGQMLSQFMNFNQLPTTGVVLPDHPVKIGDTWEAEVPMPIADSKAKVVSTLLGVETVGGQETLKIKQMWTIPVALKMGQTGQSVKNDADALMVMTGTGTVNSLVNVLESNARLIKTAADMDMKMNMELKGQAANSSPVGNVINMAATGKIAMDLLSAGKVEPTAPTKPAATKPSAAHPTNHKPASKP